MKYMNYQYAKASLKEVARDAKRIHPTDKPMIRQIINDYADSLSRELPPSKQDLIHNYAAQMHP